MHINRVFSNAHFAPYRIARKISSINFLIPTLFIIFALDLASSSGKGGSKLYWNMLPLPYRGRVPQRGKEHERTFLNVIFESSNFATLVSTRRYRNKASMLGVLYPYACKSQDLLHTLYIIPNGVGWLSCLSL